MLRKATVKSKICETCGHHRLYLEFPENIYTGQPMLSWPLKPGDVLVLETGEYAEETGEKPDEYPGT